MLLNAGPAQGLFPQSVRRQRLIPSTSKSLGISERIAKPGFLSAFMEVLNLSSTCMETRHRCSWAESDPLLRSYHDQEWGVPVYDSRMLWEILMLEGFQAGLSWLIILRKRDAFRAAFHDFDPQRVADFTEDDVTSMLANPGIIRSRAKINATIQGAKIFLAMKQAGQDFSEYLWGMARRQTDSEHNRHLPS